MTRTFPSDAPDLIQYMKAYLPKLWKGLFHACMRTIVLAPFPFFYQIMVDACIPSSDYWGIMELSLITTGLLLLHYVFSVHGANLIAAATAEMNLELRSRIFYKLQYLSFGYLDQQKTGRLLSKYAFDTQKVEDAILFTCNNLIPAIIYSTSVLVVLIAMNWQLSIMLLVILPIYGISKYFFFEKIANWNQAARIAQEKMTGTASEYITALRLVRSLGEEQQARNQVDQMSYGLAQSRIDLTGINASFNTFTFIGTQFITLIVVAGGALFVLGGHMSVGDLFAFISGLPILISPVQMFTQFSQQYFLGEEAYRSMKEILDCAYVEDWNGKMKLPDLKGEITFKDVSFTYPAGQQPVFQHFNLVIKPGEKIAVVGPSGSGKSTLAHLVLGLYKTDSGAVLIDGYTQQSLDMRWFRQKTALVMQESILLSGSVWENIRFANIEASNQQVMTAARDANAEEFILKMPNGYDTVVGERGSTLSGGQRQRLSIARAILRNPRVLILDEPTAALDYESEKLIQEALDRLSKGRTVITIAHRLSTIKNSDRLIVMKDGNIIEEGTFQSLSHSGGYFSNLLSSQGLLDDTDPQATTKAPYVVVPK